MRRFAVAIVVLWTPLPLPVLAQEQAAPPGCTDVVAVQGEGCFLRRVYACKETIPDGYMIAGFDGDGPATVTWLGFDGITRRNVMGRVDAVATPDPGGDMLDLSSVLQTGSDSHDFTMTMTGENGGQTRYAGTTTLTGKEIVIDGRTLQVMLRSETFTNIDGQATQVETTVLYDADLQLSLNATLRRMDTGEVVQDRMPANFIFPGEEGILSTQPVIGCGG
jgi:hypothetical protein